MSNIVSGLKSIQDYMQADAEFQLKKQEAAKAAQGAQPAAMQLANEYQKRMAAGDVQGANLLAQFAKTVDKGLAVNPDGTYAPMAGYAQGLGGLNYGKQLGGNMADVATAYQKAQQGEQGTKDVQAVMNPVIAGRESDARNASELNYAAPITTEKKTAELNANQLNDLQKKANSAQNMGTLTQQAREVLNTGAPSGGYLGATGSFFKRLGGISDAETQANTRLDIIGANLTSSVPRMEGPQSDADREYYVKQAGRVGDKTIPIGDRLEALKAIDDLNAKYSNLQTPSKDALSAAAPVSAPRGGMPVATPAPAANVVAPPKAGERQGEYMFVGGDPKDKNNWKKVK